MLIEIIIALLLGILAGTFTGLIPGIHINLISLILVNFSSGLLNYFNALVFCIFIIAMSITHTFIDFIPSIFLGAPDSDSVLSILPGHQFLLKGYGFHATILTAYGSLTGILIILILSPVFTLTLPIIYPTLRKIMFLILILASVYLIYLEKQKKLWSFIIFMIAGFLGIATLNLNLKQPLLPLFTGLFGASNLIISLKNKTKIPKQKISKINQIKINRDSFLKSSFSALISAPITSFLPGLGASQAAVIGSEISKNTETNNQKSFLFLLGAINTIVMGISFITLYSINKTRTGSAVAISEILPVINFSNFLFFLTTITISGFIAFYLTIFLAEQFAKNITKLSYKKLSIFTLFILISIIILFSNTLTSLILNVLVFLTSTILGISAIEKGIKRIHLMGSLLIPTILFYLL